ncbi:MAG: CvpA family protein [Bacteroidota bacterium]|nr:CvpA family protein [Bacteroidota bacterium]
MKPIDWIILLPLIFGAYEGYKKGFVMMLTGVLAIVLGVAGAFELLFLGIKYLEKILPNMPHILPIISFLVIFVLIVVAVYLLGMILKKALDLTIFAGKLDNVAGSIVGVVQWAFITGVLMWLLMQSGYFPKKYTSDTFILPYMVAIGPKFVGFFTWLFPFAGKLFKDIKGVF